MADRTPKSDLVDHRAPDGDRTIASRRAFLRGLTAVPTAIVLGRALGACGNSEMGSVDSSTDAVRDARAIDDGQVDADASLPDGEADAMLGDADVDGDAEIPDASAPDAELDCTPTHYDAEGPFFASGTPMRSMIATADEPGDRLKIRGTLRASTAGGCGVLAGYFIDVWQADVNGVYYDAIPTGHRLRGRLLTGEDGSYELETIMPGHYGDATGPRPAHLHFKIYSPEGAELLTTQIYFSGDPYLGDADSCGPPSCFSGDLARTVVLRPEMIGARAGMAGDLPLYV